MSKKLDFKGIATRTVCAGGGGVSAAFANDMLTKMIPDGKYRGGLLLGVSAILPEIVSDKKMKAYVEPFANGMAGVGAIVLTNSFLKDDKKISVAAVSASEVYEDYDDVQDTVNGTDVTYVGESDDMDYDDINGTDQTFVASAMQGV